uniref:Nuclear export mediator factor NEMF n=1 Tax=Plectus sambesii TaxID=2011161 RepID=A0A914WEK2_9BILA
MSLSAYRTFHSPVTTFATPSSALCARRSRMRKSPAADDARCSTTWASTFDCVSTRNISKGSFTTVTVGGVVQYANRDSQPRPFDPTRFGFFESLGQNLELILDKMKTRFSTLDLFAVIHDLQPMLGMRVANVYDIDSKTYLIKLQKPEHKEVILFESGVRIHPTSYDWPKQQSPSGFSMKLRKHIKQKRLESVRQLGVDRILDLQFGDEDRACHVIVELYDRGNVVLTDSDYIILNVLRPRTDKDVDVRFAVREKYPVELARQSDEAMSLDRLKEVLAGAKPNDSLRKVLAPLTQYGPALLEHCFISAGFPPNCQVGKTFNPEADVERLHAALLSAHDIYLSMKNEKAKGFLTTKIESRVVDPSLPNKENDSTDAPLVTYQEFHPMLFAQLVPPYTKPEYGVKELETFGQAVDEFFSNRESQKSDVKALQQEKDAVRKLQNVKKDHEQRLIALEEAQAANDRRAALIEMNKELVDKAILVIRSALANQLGWEAIQQLIDDAAKRADPVASAIKGLKLDISHITMQLTDPYADADEDDEDEVVGNERTMRVDIDLNLGAYQNARKYYDSRRAASVKQQKTVDASKKALKSAEQKTHEALKLVKVRANITKHRKPMWFEKFFWFISSENYLVIGGRDAQQNELIVKRHLLAGDVYVHADLRGASSVVIKNRSGCAAEEIPPKTLNEAGTMAVCYSAAWEAKVVTGAWWVKHDQVSRTAPSGEYLTAGSFMIRGKKNYLPPAQLQMGFGFLFKLDEDSIERHKGERKQQIGAAVEEANDQDVDVELVDEDEAESSDSEPVADESSFPDVQVGLQRLTSTGNDKDDEQVTILQLGPRRPERPPTYPHNSRQSAPVDSQNVEPTAAASKHNDQPNRRQRHKQQKMKTKYKDQDEEERELRIELLGAGGQPKVDRKAQRKAKKSGNKLTTPSVRPAPQRANNAPPSSRSKTDDQHDGEAPPADDQPADGQPTDDQVSADAAESIETKPPGTSETSTKEEDVDQSQADAADDEDGETEEVDELAVLDTLTATPVADDTLLFAVCVCAPYQVMAQYKYKVKLTPGQGKRGKAAKTALLVFQKDRGATPRERDLLKATAQDQDLSRNMPGKVKVSAPQLLAAKSKK